MSASEWPQGREPGLDLHTWESTWASIEEDAEGDLDAALSQYAELAHRMLVASGYALDDPVARQGDAPKIVATYTAARETAERAELGAASRSEVELAIDDLRDLFGTLTSTQRALRSGGSRPARAWRSGSGSPTAISSPA